MNRFARTRSDQRDSQPLPGRAQCSVGSIDDDGIRYGLTTYALIASTIAIAPRIVIAQSMAIRHWRGRPWVKRSIGFLTRFLRGFALVATPQSFRDRRRAGSPARASRETRPAWCSGDTRARPRALRRSSPP